MTSKGDSLLRSNLPPGDTILWGASYFVTVPFQNEQSFTMGEHLWIKRKVVYIFICLYVYMFIWYVRIPYMNSTLFVRDAIFPYVLMY